MCQQGGQSIGLEICWWGKAPATSISLAAILCAALLLLTFTQRSLAFASSKPFTAVQASHLALPSKSRPPRSAHMGRSVALSPWVTCSTYAAGHIVCMSQQRMDGSQVMAISSPPPLAACSTRVAGHSVHKAAERWMEAKYWPSAPPGHLHMQGVEPVEVVGSHRRTARPGHHPPVELLEPEGHIFTFAA